MLQIIRNSVVFREGKSDWMLVFGSRSGRLYVSDNRRNELYSGWTAVKTWSEGVKEDFSFCKQKKTTIQSQLKATIHERLKVGWRQGEERKEADRGEKKRDESRSIITKEECFKWKEKNQLYFQVN